MVECCMCGDYGLPSELFRCDVCGIRSQHRYCSNIYPKAESYRFCNWCITTKTGAVEGTQNSFISPTYNNNNSHEDDQNNKHSKKKNNKSSDHGHVGLKVQRGTMQLQLNSNLIKKQRSLEHSHKSRKKITAARDCVEETLRRTKSEEISNSTNGITKQVLRGKVRRYKLLDEVFTKLKPKF